MADILYGVTMQERGVSKIVSVRFNRDEGSPERVTETANPPLAVPYSELPLEGDQVLAR